MTPFYKPFFAGFLITAAIVTASSARAQDESGNAVSGSIAAGIATVPDYEGAKEQKVIPLVAANINWGARYFSIEGTSARLNLLDNKHVEFGPIANLTLGRDDKIKPLSVRALGRIKDAYEVGAFAAIKSTSLVREGDELRLRVHGVRDVHDGWTYEAAVAYRLPVSRSFFIATETAVRFADDKYAATYFSVTPAGSAASGLATYNTKGGVKDLGTSLTAVYALSTKWSLVGFGGYRRLVGDFKDSPVVRGAGRADQYSGGVGVAFRF